MDVSVTKTSAGEYDVKIGTRSFTLPADSDSWEAVNDYMAIGNDKKQLVFTMPNYGATLEDAEAEGPEVILEDDDDKQEENMDVAMQVVTAFTEAKQSKGGRRKRSRVNRKTRRSKGKRRYTKRR